MQNNFVKVEAEQMDDDSLFKSMLFMKRVTSGPITKEEFQILENIRLVEYNRVTPSQFVSVALDLYNLYKNEYFKRRQN